MSNLYEIDTAIKEAIDKGYDMAFVDENGEFKQAEYDEWLDRLKIEETQKLENIACYVKDLISEANAIKAEEKVLAERRKWKENKAERLAAYMDGFLRMKDWKRFETARCAVSYRKSTVLEVTDEEQLKKWLKRHKEFTKEVDPILNKAELKKYAKTADVPGVELVDKQNIQFK